MAAINFASGKPLGFGLNFARAGSAVVPLTENHRVLLVGDSLFAGVGGGNNKTEITAARRYSSPLQVRDRLEARGFAATADSIVGTNVTPNSTDWEDYRNDDIVPSGVGTSSSRFTAGGECIVIGAGDSLEWTTAGAVDTLEMGIIFGAPGVGTGIIKYWNGSSFVDLNPHTYDGVTVETGIALSMTAGAEAYEKHIFGGFPLQQHTFQFTRTGNFYPPFMNAYDSNTPSFQILNGGMRNWTTGDWATDTLPSNPLNAISVINPDTLVIKLCTNDMRQSGTTIATAEANIEAMIDEADAIGANVILVIPNDIQTYSTVTDTWSFAALRTLYADLLTYAEGKSSIPTALLVDPPTAMFNEGLSGATNPATFSALNTNGYMFDTLHPINIYYTAEAKLIADALITCAGVTATATPSLVISDPTFTFPSSATAGVDTRGNGDETAGSFSTDPDFATIISGTNADHFEIVYDSHEITPSAAGDAANLSGGVSASLYELEVAFAKAGEISVNTVTINIT